MLRLDEIKCLPELWVAQATKNGVWCGYYQTFHPNKEAVELEVARLRKELPSSEGWDFHVGRYELVEIDNVPVERSK